MNEIQREKQKGLLLYNINKLAKAYGKNGSNIERLTDYVKQKLYYAAKNRLLKKYGVFKGYHFEISYLTSDDSPWQSKKVYYIYGIYEVDDFLFHKFEDKAKIEIDGKTIIIKQEGIYNAKGKEITEDKKIKKIEEYMKKNSLQTTRDADLNLIDEERTIEEIKKETGIDIKKVDKLREEMLKIAKSLTAYQHRTIENIICLSDEKKSIDLLTKLVIGKIDEYIKTTTRDLKKENISKKEREKYKNLIKDFKKKKEKFNKLIEEFKKILSIN